jgi:hypothetical protein
MAKAVFEARGDTVFNERKKNPKIYGLRWVLKKHSLTDVNKGGRPGFDADDIIDAAARRIDPGNYPGSLRELAEEIVNEDFCNALPENRPAVSTVMRIIRNSNRWPEWRRLFRHRRDRPA